MEILCKKCGSSECIKHGKSDNKQRYLCKSCGCNFVLGDARKKVSEEDKALAVSLYLSGKASCRSITKLFNTDFRKVFKYYNYTLFFTIFNLGKS
ncbi:MAG: hypothetical protein CVT88_04495 [Candidatus Altiarchaeales archaeon HGW-Altiarchaeales-1]|nr:MAG: hypothetical protein CVT88_04495 [Candidatus Altiarchaeales archaeon HGW-Altiarchaeales-1]